MTNTQTILIVDADKDIARELKEILLQINNAYTVLISEDGKTALEILEKEKMALVILDIQIPTINGLQLLTDLQSKGIWAPVIIITDSHSSETNSELRNFGIIDFVKKPFLTEEVTTRINEILKNREKIDLIKNFGLPSILQLIEMEKRTGILTIKIRGEIGRLFFTNGKAMDIEIKGHTMEEALSEFINTLYEDVEISIEYLNHRKDKKINMTLIEMVMEASRIKDEKIRPPETYQIDRDNNQKTQSEQLSKITELLNSFNEVEKYIITNTQGEVLRASSGDHKEDVLYSSIYLWGVGEKVQTDFNTGALRNLTCYLKGKKRFIHKYKDLILIIELFEMIKLSAFKEKLMELLEKTALKIGGNE